MRLLHQFTPYGRSFKFLGLLVVTGLIMLLPSDGFSQALPLITSKQTGGGTAFAVPVETPDEQADDGSQIQFYMDYQF